MKGNSDNILNKYYRDYYKGFGLDIQFLDLFSRVDILASKDDKKFLFENKYRIGYSSTSPVMIDGGILIEKDKYTELKKKAAEIGAIPYYMMFFRDGYVVAVNLDKIEEPVWTTEMHNKTSYTGSVNIKKPKEVGHIHYNPRVDQKSEGILYLKSFIVSEEDEGRIIHKFKNHTR